MNGRKEKKGLTLIEILTSVVIILILASIIIGVTNHLDNQGKKRLTGAVMDLIVTALEQFRDHGYKYNNQIYADFIFPLDCNGAPNPIDFENELKDALGPTATVKITSGTYEPNYSGCAAMYFFLSQVPECKSILGRIDKALVTNLDAYRQFMTITVDGVDYPLLRVVDPWGNTLRYDYYDETIYPPDPYTRRNFPLLTSAGPDGRFGTADDITSR